MCCYFGVWASDGLNDTQRCKHLAILAEDVETADKLRGLCGIALNPEEGTSLLYHNEFSTIRSQAFRSFCKRSDPAVRLHIPDPVPKNV
jgi:hypothetical protein